MDISLLTAGDSADPDVVSFWATPLAKPSVKIKTDGEDMGIENSHSTTGEPWGSIQFFPLPAHEMQAVKPLAKPSVKIKTDGEDMGIENSHSTTGEPGEMQGVKQNRDSDTGTKSPPSPAAGSPIVAGKKKKKKKKKMFTRDNSALQTAG